MRANLVGNGLSPSGTGRQRSGGGSEQRFCLKTCGFQCPYTPVLAENRLFFEETSSRARFPQCFPHLWKSWGRNRTRFRHFPREGPLKSARECSTERHVPDRDPLTAPVVTTSIEVSSGCAGRLWTSRTRTEHEGKAHISAQRSAAQEDPWIPRPNGDKERPDRTETPPCQGPQTADGRRRALSNGAGAGTGARRASAPPARLRARVHNRRSDPCAIHDAVRRGEWGRHDAIGRGRHPKAGGSGRAEPREAFGARGLPTSQNRRGPRHCHRATPGNARCFVR